MLPRSWLKCVSVESFNQDSTKTKKIFMYYHNNRLFAMSVCTKQSNFFAKHETFSVK